MMFMVKNESLDKFKDFNNVNDFFQFMNELIKNGEAFTLHDKLGSGKTLVGFNNVRKLIKEFEEKGWTYISFETE